MKDEGQQALPLDVEDFARRLEHSGLAQLTERIWSFEVLSVMRIFHPLRVASG